RRRTPARCRRDSRRCPATSTFARCPRPGLSPSAPRSRDGRRPLSCRTSLRRGRLVQRAFQFLTLASKLLQTRGREGPTMEEAKKGRISAGPLTFAVRHELWDGNIHAHPDQGVATLVMADVVGKETALLRFNCFDFERSYVYGPE